MVAGGVTEGSDAVLTLNAGSSSLKFGLYGLGTGVELILKGEIDSIDAHPHLLIAGANGQPLEDRRWEAERPGHDVLLGDLLDWLEHHLGARRLGAAGHRIVHGGSRFAEPVRLTPEIIAALVALTPLAPLHQPLGLAPVEALTRVRPGLPQVACFDTAFHHGLKPPVSRYAIPAAYEARGIRRYGFHGLSYEFIAGRLAEIDPALPGKRTVVAHLGNGASLCAMRDGRSHDTTMGFSALEGLVMGTRPGSIDPGVLLYLLEQEGLSPRALEDLLYHQSGLLGVSGISSDVRTLLESPEPAAREALELFAFRAARETTAMANTLGGVEAIVFTGGIGEHAAPVRQMICARLAWLGVSLDAEANARSAARIDAADSRVEVRIIATDEELTIARHTAAMAGR
ncbi:MAG: acetate/propionate family kinase [Devosia sp.]|nr:acetate/propionate family kinase [Devosia sp.]